MLALVSLVVRVAKGWWSGILAQSLKANLAAGRVWLSSFPLVASGPNSLYIRLQAGVLALKL